MSSDEREFIPCSRCEWPELCEYKYACIARVAEANIRAETPPSYPCKNHADRIAVSPFAMRRCQECTDAALEAYISSDEPFDQRADAAQTSLYMGQANAYL